MRCGSIFIFPCPADRHAGKNHHAIYLPNIQAPGKRGARSLTFLKIILPSLRVFRVHSLTDRPDYAKWLKESLGRFQRN
jgi:hypothetical protein